MKTRALKFFLFFFSIRAGAEGFNAFDCLRDLFPLTERGTYQRQRVNVEKPFLANERFLVFPEVLAKKVTGFFVYDHAGAHYYDTVELKTENGARRMSIAGLSLGAERPLYQMTAQPAGLETVTIYYMPGFKPRETNESGPVILGASIMPVIGALVSRPEQYDYIYQNPQGLPEERIRTWVAKQKSGGRMPAAATELKRQLVALWTKTKKDEPELWRPLRDELRLRRAFVRDHNIDDQTFKELSRVMSGSCRE